MVMIPKCSLSSVDKQQTSNTARSVCSDPSPGQNHFISQFSLNFLGSRMGASVFHKVFTKNDRKALYKCAITDAFFITWLYNILHYSLSGVEINEGMPNEHRGYLFRACYSKGASHHLLRLAEMPARWGSSEALKWKKKRGKASSNLRLEFVGTRKVEVGSLEAGGLMGLVWGAYLAFSSWSWLERGAEILSW